MTDPFAPAPIDRILAGQRIAFFTSVVGMGGSEVLVADAMEAAHLAGAQVECWSASDAAIRTLTASRVNRLTVKHHDWPPGTSDAAAKNAANRSKSRRARWRASAPR